jgi:hypothetical protein
LSPYLPCSCGGILETMNWKEHLVFNLVFVCLAALGFWMESRNDFEHQSTVVS